MIFEGLHTVKCAAAEQIIIYLAWKMTLAVQLAVSLLPGEFVCLGVKDKMCVCVCTLDKRKL